MSRQTFISSFRRTSQEGIKAAKHIILKEVSDFVAEMAKGHDYDNIFLDKEGFFKEMPPEKMAQFMTEQTVDQAQIAVDAASIVFAHSILDAAAFDYCRVISIVAPEDWASVVDQRSIKLSDVKGSTYSNLLKGKLEEYFQQLERESLLKKADLIFARCKPPEKWSPMRNYVYDKDRLTTLDTYRHEIIHGNGPIKGIAFAEEELDFLMKTVLFFQGLVNLRYGLRLNPFYALTGKEIPPIP